MKKITGILLLSGAVLVNVPYGLLISRFNYPDILREPAGIILSKFAAGGSGLIFTWFAFALTGIPLLIATILLGRAWKDKSSILVHTATIFGIIGFIAQLIGLLRWVFVVPVIAQSYVSSGASESTKAAAVATFQAVHQFGGVLLGEYIGQLFTIGWMMLLSIVLLRSYAYRSIIGWLGIVASAVYLLGQTELLHTTIPTFPSIDIAGFLGSILWLVWMILLGVFLLKNNN